MNDEYTKWHICCLLRELEKQMPDRVKSAGSRDYIFDSIRRASPSKMSDVCSTYTLDFLLMHLIEWWSKSSVPIEGLDHFRDEIKRRLDADKA